MSNSTSVSASAALADRIRDYFEAERQVRRGVCLLNAGSYGEAAEAFRHAQSLGCTEASLQSFLAACCLGEGRTGEAAAHFEADAGSDGDTTTNRIRHALCLARSGKLDAAIDALRTAVARDPESAELHFQLGTLLTTKQQYEEAELRFVQAATIDPRHSSALVSVALCCAVRGANVEAVEHLRRAQRRRPSDPRIGLLLSQAAAVARQSGHCVRVVARMPDRAAATHAASIAELSHAIEREPDVVDACVSLPAVDADERLFGLLLSALDDCLGREPSLAELHLRRGQVLQRLGRDTEAIAAYERAVDLDGGCVRALIELGHLYGKTDRPGEAIARLESAIAMGADYADVQLALGKLYEGVGRSDKARAAFRRAVVINGGYRAAVEALESLAT